MDARMDAHRNKKYRRNTHKASSTRPHQPPMLTFCEIILKFCTSMILHLSILDKLMSRACASPSVVRSNANKMYTYNDHICVYIYIHTYIHIRALRTVSHMREDIGAVRSRCGCWPIHYMFCVVRYLLYEILEHGII